MHKSYCLMLGLLLAAVLVVSGTAASRAAPVGGVVGDLMSKTDAVWRKVALRCWQRGGTRHCRSYRGERTYGNGYSYRSGNGDYYVHDADKLPFGSARWWAQMQRENRTGGNGTSGAP
jgi:hypothetical protein